MKVFIEVAFLNAGTECIIDTLSARDLFQFYIAVVDLAQNREVYKRVMRELSRFASRLGVGLFQWFRYKHVQTC